jgi:hypothetical protein
MVGEGGLDVAVSKLHLATLGTATFFRDSTSSGVHTISLSVNTMLFI